MSSYKIENGKVYVKETKWVSIEVPALDKLRKDLDYELHECPYHYDEEHINELYAYQEGLEFAINRLDEIKKKLQEESVWQQ